MFKIDFELWRIFNEERKYPKWYLDKILFNFKVESTSKYDTLGI